MTNNRILENNNDRENVNYGNLDHDHYCLVKFRRNSKGIEYPLFIRVKSMISGCFEAQIMARVSMGREFMLGKLDTRNNTAKWLPISHKITRQYYPSSDKLPELELTDRLLDTVITLYSQTKASKPSNHQISKKVREHKKLDKRRYLAKISKEKLIPNKSKKSKPKIVSTVKAHESIGKYGILEVKNSNPLPEKLETFGYGYKAHYSNKPLIKRSGSIGTVGRGC